MPLLTLHWLGTISASINGQPLSFRTRKAQALLVYLTTEAAFHGPQPVRRDTLVGLLWGDYPEKSARQNLRTNLSYLGSALSGLHEGGALLSDHQQVHLHPDLQYNLDIASFLGLLNNAAGHDHPDLAACAPCLDKLEQAAALYRGDFLADFHLPDTRAFEEWVQARREVLRRQALEALENLADAYFARADFERAEANARRQLAIEPLRESAHRQLMRTLAAGGRRAAAISHFETLKDLLRQELDIEPTPETHALIDSIQSGDGISPDQKLQQPELNTSPAVSAGGARTAVYKIPAELSSFVGREKEIADVVKLLQKTRLISLTGPGGTGKTRLAIQIARRVGDNYPNGVFFVPLESVSDPHLFATHVAQWLDLSVQGNEPPEVALESFLKDKKLLAVLDNFEHILDAAPQITVLLGAAPGLTVLATSREILNLSGEYEYLVPPLALPEENIPLSAASLLSSEAVALFEQRARAARPDFRVTDENAPVVAGICRRLDGLPLAIELAAARIKLFSPGQLLERLERRLDLLTGGSRDLPARQRTLRATIDWSYKLLDLEEQRLFARLAAFGGGGTLEAVETICGPGLKISVLDGLTSLLDKSMVDQRPGADGEVRFQFLQFIHEYADEMLAESGEEKIIRNRHHDYFLDFAKAAESQLFGPNFKSWLRRLEDEDHNFRNAIDWSQSRLGDIEMAARLIGGLGEYWSFRGHYAEGRQQLNWALSKINSEMQPATRGKVFLEAGRLAFELGENQEARDHLEKSVAIFDDLGVGIKKELANALRSLGLTESHLGNNTRATELIKRSLSIFRDLKDLDMSARVLWHLGDCEIAAGNYTRADEYFTEAKNTFQQTDNLAGFAQILSSMGEVKLREGKYERARALMEESQALHLEIGHDLDIARGNGGLGWVALKQGHLGDAYQYLRESLELRLPLRDSGGIAWGLEKMAELAFSIADRGENENMQNLLARSATLLGAADALRASTGSVVDQADQENYERLLGTLKAGLGEESFDAAWEAGGALSMEEAVRLAIERKPLSGPIGN